MTPARDTMYREPVVLLVEDDPDDQELARFANRKLDRPCRLEVVDDGVDALDYLDRTGRDGATPAPDLLMVDLAMPRMDGLTLLRRLREHPTWRRLPVVIFTTSTADRDVATCYESGCSSYVVKPMTIRGLTESLERIADYWFGCVRLPAA